MVGQKWIDLRDIWRENFQDMVLEIEAGDEGGDLEGIEGASQVSSYPSGWMALPSAERRHWKKTGFWGEVMGLVLNMLSLKGR